jgi:hypothetical protein
VYLTTVQTLFLDLNIKAARRIQSCFWVPTEIYKFEVISKPWDSNTEGGYIHADEAGV